MRKGVVGRWVLESTCATTVGSVKCTRRRVLSWLGRGGEIERARKEVTNGEERRKSFGKKSDRKLEGDEHQLCCAIN